MESNFGESFCGGRKHVSCYLCYSHNDSESLSFMCPVLKNEIDINGTFDEIFDRQIKLKSIKMINKITEKRAVLFNKN